MEYTINKLSKMAGISTRTLRYYDQIGLLKPARINTSNYRIYSRHEVDNLQQILFYKELGFDLDKIKQIINSPDFNKEKALYEHMDILQKKRMQVNSLIKNIARTIDNTKGLVSMTDKEKFEGFKKKPVEDNEQKFGTEIRKKYGTLHVDKSTASAANKSLEKP
jgi:DNA-binding transcriptional MerR regulator